MLIIFATDLGTTSTATRVIREDSCELTKPSAKNCTTSRRVTFFEFLKTTNLLNTKLVTRPTKKLRADAA